MKVIEKMALKTFNINEKTYKEYSEHCKKEGISMSKKIENFIKRELEKIKNHANIKKEHGEMQKTRNQKEELSKENNAAKISSEFHSFSKYC